MATRVRIVSAGADVWRRVSEGNNAEDNKAREQRTGLKRVLDAKEERLRQDRLGDLSLHSL